MSLLQAAAVIGVVSLTAPHFHFKAAVGQDSCKSKKVPSELRTSTHLAPLPTHRPNRPRPTPNLPPPIPRPNGPRPPIPLPPPGTKSEVG